MESRNVKDATLIVVENLDTGEFSAVFADKPAKIGTGATSEDAINSLISLFKFDLTESK